MKFIKELTKREFKISGGFWNSDTTYPAKLKPHIGEDYPLNNGTPLYMPTIVRVIKIGGHADYGNQIFVYDENYDETYHFAHLSWIDPALKVGTVIKRGHLFAKSGATGKGFDGHVISNGVVPHLHQGRAKGKVTDTGKYTNTWLPISNWNYVPKDTVGEEYKLTPEVATFYPDRNIRVRTKPHRVNGKQVGLLGKGNKVRYDGYIHADGHVWISWKEGGERRFLAIREYNNGSYGKKWGDIK